MKKETALQLITTLLACLFFYAAFSKLLHYEQSKTEMRNQIFPNNLADVLTWLVPLIELLLVAWLLSSKARLQALWFSALLLISFSLYIALIMTGLFGFIPCSCGGILKNMSHSTHLVFNLCFVAIAFLGVAITNHSKITKKWFKHQKERGLA